MLNSFQHLFTRRFRNKFGMTLYQITSSLCGQRNVAKQIKQIKLIRKKKKPLIQVACVKSKFCKIKIKFSTLKFCCCKQHSRYENINETLQRICLSDFETLKIYKITSYSLQWLSANIFVTTLACFFFLWFVSFFCLAIKKKEMNILFILNILLSIVRQSLTYYS